MCCASRRHLVHLIALIVCGAGLGAEAAQGTWFLDGQPTAQAREAVELLAQADTHGLAPPDYDAAALTHAVKSAAQQPLDAASITHLEQQLTAAIQRYLTDLHSGRIAPQDLPHGYAAPKRKPFDAATVLRDALAQGRLTDAARAAAPRLSQYEQLRTALAQYRALDGHPAWSAPLPSPPPGIDRSPPKLEPGVRWAGLPLLRQRLIALGDLDPATPAASTYDAALVDAVKSFQRRHGLSDDGIVGKATLTRLEVAPSARVRQIELALERLRWTPLLQGRRMVVINIPEFMLRAYEVQGDRIVVRETMKIIVGKALDTRTPLFEEEMRYIEFSPYWNVPPSIARGEVVPRLKRDPAYWQREGFEFVTAGGSVVDALSPALLDATLAGAARIRQRPGPRNALGDIKFVFPNRDNIYLHHTPTVGLFERDRRDFSHGCIRVERPVALALFVLAGTPDWSEDRVRAAMRAGDSRTLPLADPIPVLIAYGTAIVKGDRIHFFDDLYGHDRALDAALRKPRPPLTIDR
ncbi:MAG TPA: L,D-transpeptidase family protein [Burkholderiaceae bacterium]|nr:L,D-transpeptidase family protein [Burkholderiaceae bacterium]